MKHLVKTIAIALTVSAPTTYAATVYVDPPGKLVHPGDDFTLTLRALDLPPDTFSAFLRLSFDPAVLSVTDATLTAPWNAPVPTYINNGAGTFSFAQDTAFDATPAVSGNVAVATVDFHANAVGTSDIKFLRAQFRAGDRDLSVNKFFDIPPNVINGVVFVVAPVPVPATAWLLGSSVLGLALIRRQHAG